MSKLKSGLSTLKSICVNYNGVNHLKLIQPLKVRGDYTITSLKLNEMWKIKKDFKIAFSSNILLSSWLVFLLFRTRLCFVLRNQEGFILAYMLFMFNESELRSNYIHASSLFASPGFLNTGVGAILESEVLHYLKKETSLSGVMARVTVMNKNAYKLIEYNGFEILSEYTDLSTNERRVYCLKKIDKDAGG